METKLFTTSDGVQTVFSVTFPYIDKSHVLVQVNDVPVTFTWLGATQIELAAPAAAGAKVTRERVTPSSPLVDFTQGSALSEADLDLISTQGLFLAQEAKDALETSVILDSSGAFTTEDRRLTGLLDPTNPKDATNKQWVEAFAANFVSQAQAARDAANAAASSATTNAAAAALSAAQAAASAAIIDFNRTTNNTWTGTNTFAAAVTLAALRASGVLTITKADGSEVMVKATPDGAVELYHNGIKKIETDAAGVTVTGVLSETDRANEAWTVKSGAAFGTWYQNLTGRKINVAAVCASDPASVSTIALSINSTPVDNNVFTTSAEAGSRSMGVYGSVPPGHYYRVYRSFALAHSLVIREQV